MKKMILLFCCIPLLFAACGEKTDEGVAGAAPVLPSPCMFEIGAGEGGVYVFTTNVPAYVDGFKFWSAEPSGRELLSGEEWERPKALPVTLEQGWFSLTQRDDTTFEVTVSEEHETVRELELGLMPYVIGDQFPHAISFYLR